MALRVWLPLNGNIENQGLSDLKFNTIGTPVTQPGKTGNNYYFSGTSTYLKSDDTDVGDFISNYTMSIWIKPDTDAATGWRRVCGRSSHKQYHFDINSAGKLRFWVSKDGRDTDGHRTVITTTTAFTDGKWHHICGVNDGQKIYLYVDGVLEKSTDFLGGYSLPSAPIMVGNLGESTATLCFKGMLADFRLYDEVLSTKQIKELSKGLVAHYRMEGTGANPNLLKGTNEGTRGWYFNVGAYYTKSMEEVEWNGTRACRFGITAGDSSSSSNWKVMEFKTLSYTNVVLQPSTNYTVSFDSDCEIVDACKIASGSSTHNLTDYSNNVTYTISNNGVYHYKIALTTYSSDNKGWTYDDQFLYIRYKPGTNTSGIVANLKLEEGTEATSWIPHIDDRFYNWYNNNLLVDVSGNGHNLIKAGTLTYNISSPRYEGSTKFTSAFLNSSAGVALAGSRDFTISGWFYRTGANNITYYASAETYNTSVDLEGSRYFVYNSSGTAYVGNWSSTQNEWQHIVLVHDSDEKTLSLYVNGTYVSQVATDGTIYLNNTLTIGGRQNSANFAGSMSDFRIYSTVLSSSDIKELYQTSMCIDKQKNVYAYEFKEV